MRQKMLFLDIETVSQSRNFEDLNEHCKELWEYKSRYFIEKDPQKSCSELYTAKAAIYAEFGKIVCISLGFQDGQHFRVKSITGDEKELIESFFQIIQNNYADARNAIFVGHNIKEFDIPYICRRAVIHRLVIPSSLQLSGKKPWDISHIHDTLDMWRFGDYKHYTSLDLLSFCLGLPSSKQDISGKDVGEVFWNQNDIDRISKYCIQDVILTARVYKRLKYEDDILDDQIIYR